MELLSFWTIRFLLLCMITSELWHQPVAFDPTISVARSKKRAAFRKRLSRFAEILKFYERNKRKEFHTIDTTNTNQLITDGKDFCCPSKTELIQPFFGRNQSGHLVELYRDADTEQRFFEDICYKEVLHKPCHFVKKGVSRHSKCVQKHTFTYALVRVESVTSGWALDHIRIKNGCACQVNMGSMRKKWDKNRTRRRYFDLRRMYKRKKL